MGTATFWRKVGCRSISVGAQVGVGSDERAGVHQGARPLGPLFPPFLAEQKWGPRRASSQSPFPPKTADAGFWAGPRFASGGILSGSAESMQRPIKGFPPLQTPARSFRFRPSSGPKRCILSPLFSKKWLYGRGSTHDPDRLKLPAVALAHRLPVRSCGGDVTRQEVYITMAEAMERNM